MHKGMFLSFGVCVALLNGAGCHSKSEGGARGAAKSAAAVDAARMVHADDEAGNWMSYGRTYSEQRFSPLKLINDQNVGQLGLVWYIDLETRRGQEATPLVVDGVMYY